VARTEQQNQQIREARKEMIRVEALKQFAAKGFAGTRIKDIAQAAGIAQGLMYHYYQSKDAIFTDLIEDALDKLNQASIHVKNMDTLAKNKILYAIRKIYKTIETSERFKQTCCLIAQAENSTVIPVDVKILIEGKRDLPYEIIAEVMKQGQKEGSVVEGSPHELAILFWTSIDGLSIYYATHKNPGYMPDYKIFAAMFLKEKNI